MTVKLIGYPVLFATPYSPAPGVEEVISPRVMERSLREHANIKCLLNHDAAKEVACLDDGTLRLQMGPDGVRIEIDVADDTAPRRDLLAALDAGTIRGGSFGWTMLRNRWHLGRTPVRVEVIEALVSETSIIIAPHTPRFAGTWVRALGPQMLALHRHLEWQRARCTAAPPQVVAELAPDLVLTLPRPSYGRWGPLIRMLEDQMAPEWRAVQAATLTHPHAKTIDVRYARSVKSAHDAMRRRFPETPADLKTKPSSRRKPDPSKSRAPLRTTTLVAPGRSPQGGVRMPSTTEHDDLERRPSPGFCGTRSGAYDAARRSLERFKAEHEARDRGPRGLSVNAARLRLAQQSATWTP